MRLLTNIKIINYAISFLLLGWLSTILYKQFQTHITLRASVKKIVDNWNTHTAMLLIIVVLLMVINWSVEAIKWRLLLKDVQAISFTRSLRSVFSGISISLLTPNRIGEYAGRVVYLQNINKAKGVMANIIGSFAQFIAAGCFGIGGMLLYYLEPVSRQYLSANNIWYFLPVLLFSFLLLVILLVAFYNLGFLANRLYKFKRLHRIISILKIVENYNNQTLRRLIILSAFRYFIFASQYYLLLQIFGVSISYFVAMASIFCIYWLMAIVPSVAIAEVGLRAELSVVILSAFSSNTFGIMSTSVLLWLINLIIPALIGACLLFGIKLIGNK